MSDIIRISKVGGDQFTVLSHHAVRNKALSRRARGLLWEILSFPPGWTLRHEWLARNATDSKHKLQSAVSELREHCYLSIQRKSGGETTWLVTDDPDSFPLEKPHPDNQDVALTEPQSDKPSSDNRVVEEERTFLAGMLEEEGGAPPKAKRKKKLPEIPMPDDWEPTKAHIERCKAEGLDLEFQVEKFKAHAEMTDRRMASWNGGFTTWLLNAVGWRREKGGSPGTEPTPYEDAMRLLEMETA